MSGPFPVPFIARECPDMTFSRSKGFLPRELTRVNFGIVKVDLTLELVPKSGPGGRRESLLLYQEILTRLAG
jgi:hypothetical protein